LPGRRGIAAIVGWSLAAQSRSSAIVLFAFRSRPIAWRRWCRRHSSGDLGDVAEGQVNLMFGGKICDLRGDRRLRQARERRA